MTLTLQCHFVMAATVAVAELSVCYRQDESVEKYFFFWKWGFFFFFFTLLAYPFFLKVSCS